MKQGSSIAGNPVLIGAATTLVVLVAIFLSYNANAGLPFVPTYILNVEAPSAANLVKGNDAIDVAAYVAAVTGRSGQDTGALATAGLSGATSGDQIFQGAGCASCHTLAKANASGTIGPNLDKELTADPASAARESIVDPNKEIIPGYSANVMPTNYGTALTKTELDALVNYVYHSTNTKAKAKAAAKTSTP